MLAAMQRLDWDRLIVLAGADNGMGELVAGLRRWASSKDKIIWGYRELPSARPDRHRHALATANTWPADISAALNTDDRHFSRRALRAWLHTMRDRRGADSVAKLGAQLPELMRGTATQAVSLLTMVGLRAKSPARQPFSVKRQRL